jgi:hypothetical protein
MNVKAAIRKGMAVVSWGHEVLPAPSETEILSLFPKTLLTKGWLAGIRAARAHLPAGTIPKGLKDMTWGELLEAGRVLAQRSSSYQTPQAHVIWMFLAGATLAGKGAKRYRPERERLCRLCPRHAKQSMKYCYHHTRGDLNAYRHAIRVHSRMSQEWKDRHTALNNLVGELAKGRDPKLDVPPGALPEDWRHILVAAGAARTPADALQDGYQAFIDNLKGTFPDRYVYQNYDFAMWKGKTILLAEQNKVDSWKPDMKAKLRTSDLPARIRKLAREGRTRAEIAKICGVTRAAITQAIKRNNLEGAFQRIIIGDDGGDDFYL